MGVDCHELDDGVVIHGDGAGGGTNIDGLSGGTVDAEDDHRIAMSFLIAGQFSSEPIAVKKL